MVIVYYLGGNPRSYKSCTGCCTNYRSFFSITGLTISLFLNGYQSHPQWQWKAKNIVAVVENRKKHCAAAIPTFRQPENQYIDFRLPFLFLN